MRHLAPALRPLVVLVGCLTLAGRPALAQTVTGFLEIVFSDSESTEQVQSLPPSVIEGQTLLRRLNVSFRQQASRVLSFYGGGTFESQDVTLTELGSETEADLWNLRPYLGIERRTRHLATQLTWNRDRSRSSTSVVRGPIFVRDSWNGATQWTPDRLPTLRVAVGRRTDHDAQRRQRDFVRDFLTLDLNQDLLRDRVRWTYRGGIDSTDDRLNDASTTSNAHRGDVVYQDRWWDNRAIFRAKYAIAYRATQSTTGGGEVEVPVFALEGLVARDDTPLVGALAPLPALIDGDVAVATPIDLGLPAPGEDDRPWGIGLDLERSLETNTIFVWIDRELPPALAASYSWRVFSSDDNRDWLPRQVVTDVTYDDFLRRFTLRFTGFAARYVKVVVDPLAPGVPNASGFPDVFVTEIAAAVRVTTTDDHFETSTTSQTLESSTRIRLLRSRNLFYEGNYYASRTDGRDPRYRLLNGLFYSEAIDPRAIVSARVSWEQESEPQRDSSALNYVASLTSTPTDRLRYTVSLTGRNEQIEDRDGADQIGVFWYGSAELFRGVSVQLGVGRSHRQTDAGRRVESTQINGSARIDPRSDLTIGLSYVDATSDQTGDGLLTEGYTRAADLNAAYTPFPTLYVFGSYRLEWRTGDDTERQRRWIVSWTPLSAAALRLGINYNETRSERTDRLLRSTSPFVRWNLNARSWLEFSYFKNEDTTGLRRLETEIGTATFRWGF